MRVIETNFCSLLITSVSFLVLVVVLGIAAPMLWAEDRKADAQIPFGDVIIRIEFNSTDEDVGIQIDFDGKPWKRVFIVNPNGSRIFEVFGRGKLTNFGLTQLFSESHEPPLDEMPLPDFLALFPEGEYKFFGTTVEGETLESTATLTHNIPDGPSIVSPERNAVVDPQKAIIRWDPVTTPPGIQISGYLVTVDGGKPDRAFSIELPATATSVRVPPALFESGSNYKFEVLAIEVGGNQTISSGSFKTK